jgi:hypothetical protein
LNEAAGDAQFAQRGWLIGQPQRQSLLTASRLGAPIQLAGVSLKEHLGRKGEGVRRPHHPVLPFQAIANVSSGTSQEAMNRLFRSSQGRSNSSPRWKEPGWSDKFCINPTCQS